MDSNTKKLVDCFNRGCKKQGSGKLGIEVEHFLVNKENKETVSYYGAGGVEDLLGKLSCYFENKGYSEGHIISLKRKNCLISLEPAAQVEISIGEFEKIQDIEDEYVNFCNQINPFLESQGLELVTLGYHPKSKIADLKLIPKPRYYYMDDYFKETGEYGKNMMRGTAATQVSIDYFSEKDFINKFRLANILTPVFSFLTDNTPVFEGEKSLGMTRAMIWDGVDIKRSGIIPQSLDGVFGFQQYADYILSNPPIIVSDNQGKLIYTKQLTAKEIYKDSVLSDSEAEHLLSMFFPHVRLRNYIEIRIADSMPIKYVLGYVSLIKGIFYNEENLQELLRFFISVKNKDAKEAFIELKNKKFSASVYNMPVVDILNKICLIAKRGLKDSEIKYLDAIYELFDENHNTRPLNLMI